MNTKKLNRPISICLFITILLGTIMVGMVDQSAQAADPFMEMKDEYLQETHAAVPYEPDGFVREDTVLKSEDRTGVISPEEQPADSLLDDRLYPKADLDTGKTDRYIVKYKDGKEVSFKNKASSVLETSARIAPSISSETGALVTIGTEDTTTGISNTLDGRLRIYDRVAIDLPVDNAITNMEVLILAEKRLPSEFAAELKAMGADEDIEYIQPDFKLSLDSFGLELIDNDGTEPIIPPDEDIPETDDNDIHETDGELELELEEEEDIEAEIATNNSVLVAVN